MLLTVPVGPSGQAKTDSLERDELARTRSTIDPEAGAEIILDETLIDNEDPSRTRSTRWVRTRIYHQRGVDAVSTVKIPYGHHCKLRKIEVRTFQPDGTVLDLNSQDIMDQEVYDWASGVRSRELSFSPLGLSAGAIVEYRYVSEQPDTGHFVFSYARPLPARLIRYRYRAVDGRPEPAYFSVNTPNPKLTKDKEGYYTFELKNVAALRDEPFGPPILNVAPVTVLYENPDPDEKGTYAKARAKQLASWLATKATPGPEVTDLASQLVSSSDANQIKLRKLYDYCRSRIRNTSLQRQDPEGNPPRHEPETATAEDTLKEGAGSAVDINLLFAALSRAAGFDVRLAACTDRSVMVFDKAITAPFLLKKVVVAVNLGDDWQYFDPGSIYLHAGMLDWQNGDTAILLGDEKEPILKTANGVPAELSTVFRRGDFKLDADGNLEGDVTVQYTGLWSVELKYRLEGDDDEGRAAFVREDILALLPGAEISGVRIDHVRDPLTPLSISFHLQVPQYAKATETRISLQPAIFQKNLPPLFQKSERKSDIFFRFRSSEMDEISIQPPVGFQLDAPVVPVPLTLGEFGSYSVQTRLGKKDGRIHFSRKLTKKAVLVSKEKYVALKSAFDAVRVRDNDVVTLFHGTAPR